MMTKQYDLIIIGGGPAGYSAAIHAARIGKRTDTSVCLVESGELGGTCLNRGCIPTKTLVETADLLDRIRGASVRGIDVSGIASIDLAKTFQYKDRIVKRMSAGVGVLLRENGVDRVSGTAEVQRNTDEAYPFIVSVSGESGTPDDLLARKVILATGSVPATLTSLGTVSGYDSPDVASRILTSDDVLRGGGTMDILPDRLVILGGGVIGIEMSRIFKAFGSDVHLIEALPRLTPFLDAQVSAALQKSIIDKKIKVSTGRTLQRIEWADGDLLLFLDEGTTVRASHLLVAVGRLPKTDMLSNDLMTALKPNRRGFLPVDLSMRTQVPGLFAPGDVNGRCMLAHAAMEMGRVAAIAAVEEIKQFGQVVSDADVSNLESLPDSFPRFVPGCIYGDPEVGYIGWTEEDARREFGEQVRVGHFPFAANGRAASSGHRDGFVKVICLAESQQVLGVHLIGPCAAELINEVSTVLALGGNVQKWAAAVHAHPTYGEALVEAVADTFGEAVHLPPRKRGP